MKICTGCNKSKALTEFHRHPRWKDGHYNRCKECRNAWKRNYDAQWRLDHPGYQSEAQRRWKYGLSLTELTNILESQGALCAICKTELLDPCVDHDHKTKKVRGLLCRKCNLGLGYFMDDPDRLQSAIDYLSS